MNRLQILSSGRHAGQVKRYHTWPVLQQQTVAEHTFHVMRIHWEIWRRLPEHMCAYYLWHDSGEVAVGDLPFPVKSDNPALKELVEGLEIHAVVAMGGAQPTLSPFDKLRAKLCDLIEMNEFGRHEMSLGNTYAEPIVDDTRARIWELGQHLDESEQRAINSYFERTQGGVGLWAWLSMQGT